MRSAFKPLRSQFVFATLRRAFKAAGADESRFRILQYSVQFDHLHLIVEAEDKQALSRGVQGLAIRIARYVNDLLMRKGKFWADRWHGRELTSPRAVRNAIAYVLMNFRKHARTALPPGIDAFASGESFDGWLATEPARRIVAHAAERPPPRDALGTCVAQPRTWLARFGWRRHGPLTLSEQPRKPE